MYVAQVVYQVRHYNEWRMYFIVAKDHVVLLKVSVPIIYPIIIINIQYIESSLPPNVEMDITFQFSFQDSNGFIELVFDEEQEYPFNGWRIICHRIPSIVCILI